MPDNNEDKPSPKHGRKIEIVPDSERYPGLGPTVEAIEMLMGKPDEASGLTKLALGIARTLEPFHQLARIIDQNRFNHPDCSPNRLGVGEWLNSVGIGFTLIMLAKRGMRPTEGPNFPVLMENDPTLSEKGEGLSVEDKVVARASSLATAWFESAVLAKSGQTAVKYPMRLSARTIPRQTADTMVFPSTTPGNDSTMIVSIRGREFEINMVDKRGHVRPPDQVQQIIADIVKVTNNSPKKSISPAVFSGLPRNEWAEIHKEIEKSSPANKAIMERRRKSGLFMALEPDLVIPSGDHSRAMSTLRSHTENVNWDGHCLRVFAEQSADRGGTKTDAVAGILCSHEANDGNQMLRFAELVTRGANRHMTQILSSSSTKPAVDGASYAELSLDRAALSRRKKLAALFNQGSVSERIVKRVADEAEQKRIEAFILTKEDLGLEVDLKEFWTQLGLPYNEVFQLATMIVLDRIYPKSVGDTICQPINNSHIEGGRVSMAYMSTPGARNFVRDFQGMQRGYAQRTQQQERRGHWDEVRREYKERLFETIRGIRFETERAQRGGNPKDVLCGAVAGASVGFLRRIAAITGLLVGTFEKVDPSGVAQLNLEKTVASNGGPFDGCKFFGTTAARPDGNVIGYKLNKQGGLSVEVSFGKEYTEAYERYVALHKSTQARKADPIPPLTLRDFYVSTLRQLIELAKS